MTGKPPGDPRQRHPKQCSAAYPPVELAGPANSEGGRRLHRPTDVWVISGHHESTQPGSAPSRLRYRRLVGSGKQAIPSIDRVG